MKVSDKSTLYFVKISDRNILYFVKFSANIDYWYINHLFLFDSLRVQQRTKAF